MDYSSIFDKFCTGIVCVQDRFLMQQNGGKVGDGILGTAFLIDKKDANAIFATAKHVVSDYANNLWSNLELIFSYSTSSSGIKTAKGVMHINNIQVHPTKDIAIIFASPENIPRIVVSDKAPEGEQKQVGANLQQHLTLNLGQVPKVGEPLIIIGYGKGTGFIYLDEILGKGSPKTLVPIAKHGIVSQIVPADGRPVELFLCDMEIAGGFSGSPIILANDSPEVVGILTHGYGEPEDISYAHTLSGLHELLKSSM